MFNSTDIGPWAGLRHTRRRRAIADPTQLPPPPINCQGIIYRVAAGDSLFGIAEQFGVSLQQLIVANPQIRNPNIIFPNQEICVPVQRQIAGSCAVLLSVISPELAAALDPWAGGVARLVAPEPDYTVVTIAASGLPEPGTFGNFDGYVGAVRQRRGAETQHFSAVLTQGEGDIEMPSTWAGSRRVPGLLEAQDEIFVRPYNTAADVAGEIIFAANLAGCVM